MFFLTLPPLLCLNKQSQKKTELKKNGTQKKRNSKKTELKKKRNSKKTELKKMEIEKNENAKIARGF